MLLADRFVLKDALVSVPMLNVSTLGYQCSVIGIGARTDHKPYVHLVDEGLLLYHCFETCYYFFSTKGG